jgi:hypothetical protein
VGYILARSSRLNCRSILEYRLTSFVSGHGFSHAAAMVGRQAALAAAEKVLCRKGGYVNTLL